MRTAAKTLVGILLLLLAILAGLLAAPFLFGPFEIDLSGRRDLLEGWVREHAGWEIGIEQGPTLELSRRIRVSAGGVRLENSGWKGRQELFKAREVMVALDLWPLLLGRLEAGEARLVDAEVQVDKDRSGHANWQPVASEKTQEGQGTRWSVPAQLDLQVENSVLKFRDRQSAVEFTLRVKTATAFSPADDAVIQLAVDSDLDGTPVDLSGQIGSLPDLLAADEPYPIDVEANLLGIGVQAKGTVANPLSGAEVAARVDVQGKSLAGLKPWLGQQAEKIGPVKGRMELLGGANSYRLDPIELDLGKGQIRGRVQLDTSRSKPRLTAEITAQQLDLRPFLPGKPKIRREAVSPDVPQPEPGPEGTAARQPGSEVRKLFSADPLPLQWLDALDADLKLKAKAVRTHWSSVNNLDSSLQLQDKRLELSVKADAQGHRRVSVKAAIDGQARPPAFSVTWDGDKYRLEPWVALTDARGLIEGELEILVQLKARGRSVAEVMGSLDGKVFTLWDEAKADVKTLDSLIGGAGALLGQLVRPKDKLAVVNCGVLSLNFEQGQGRVQGLFDTQYSTVVGQGDLDLSAETLALRVQPKSKGVTLSVAAPVIVKGPLADPSVSLEASGALFKLTDVLAKLAIPHLLLVDALGDEVSDNPCVALVSGQVKTPATGTVEGTAGAVTSGAGSVIKGTGEAVKGLLGGTPSQPETEKAPAEKDPAPQKEQAPRKDSGLPAFH